MKSQFLKLKTFKHSIKIENLKFKIIILVFLFLILMPFQVFAVDYLPLVPCGISKENAAQLKAEGKGIANWDYTKPCTRCHAFKLTENMIDFTLKGLVPPVAAVLFIAGGLMILLSGARPEWIGHGKKIFWNTFIGLVIILASWLIVNTFIQSFGPDQVKGSWFKYVCKDSVITGPPTTGICSRPESLAQQNNAVFPRRNAPELDALIACVNSLPPVRDVIDQSQVYTFERSNNLCNFTRGRPICGACQHKINSCHYGGPNGSQGSLAVDFNAKGVSEQELFNRLSSIRNACNFGFIKFEGDHTHVSAKSCAGDTGGD